MGNDVISNNCVNTLCQLTAFLQLLQHLLTMRAGEIDFFPWANHAINHRQMGISLAMAINEMKRDMFHDNGTAQIRGVALWKRLFGYVISM